VARCVIVMQKPLSLPLLDSSELDHATSAKLACRNDQAVRTHGAPSHRCQRIPGTFWLTLVAKITGLTLNTQRTNGKWSGARNQQTLLSASFLFFCWLSLLLWI
jgi:hypothetical protein